MAVRSRMFPLLEVEEGVRWTLREPKDKIPVRDYIKMQGRFAHLTDVDLEAIQEDVDKEWELLVSKASVIGEV
jgi:pyruvate/2-oxoacid:ferredoxin oxidoreductase beta subunit